MPADQPRSPDPASDARTGDSAAPAPLEPLAADAPLPVAIVAPATPDKPAETGPGAGPVITPAQIRGARGMVGMSKDELARRSEVSVSTIMRLEDAASGVRPRSETLQAVRRVLEQAGVAFTFEPGAKPGLREA